MYVNECKLLRTDHQNSRDHGEVALRREHVRVWRRPWSARSGAIRCPSLSVPASVRHYSAAYDRSIAQLGRPHSSTRTHSRHHALSADMPLKGRPSRRRTAVCVIPVIMYVSPSLVYIRPRLSVVHTLWLLHLLPYPRRCPRVFT